MTDTTSAGVAKVGGQRFGCCCQVEVGEMTPQLLADRVFARRPSRRSATNSLGISTSAIHTADRLTTVGLVVLHTHTLGAHWRYWRSISGNSKVKPRIRRRFG